MKIFYIHINDDDMTGMDAISLVDYPAVEHNFLCFEKEQSTVKFAKDESKHIISGIVALANTPIYRFDPVNGEYWVVFEKDTILKMIEKYSKNNLFNSINIQHNDNDKVDSLYLVESYIIDKERGICPKEFADVEDGSWVASFKVEDEQLWNEIVNGDALNGFSLQGMFELNTEKEQPKEEPDPIDSLINKILE